MDQSQKIFEQRIREEEKKFSEEREKWRNKISDKE
jgi:hypothetical protein